MLPYCFLASLVSDDKSAATLLKALVHHQLLLSCCSQGSLSFNNLIMMCLCVDLFEFNRTCIYGASWICRLILFTQFGKFSAIISSNILLSFSLFLGTHHPVLWMLVCPIVFHRSEALFNFLYPFLEVVPQLTHHQVCSTLLISYWTPVNFSFYLLYFSTPEFYLITF